MKKILSLFLVLCLTFICSLSSFAATEPNNIPEKPVNYGNPVDVRTYYDEELGSTVTERIYFVPSESGVAPYSFGDKTGEGWFKNEKTANWNSGARMTYYAEGYFKWKDGNISVSNASGGYDNMPPKCSVRSEDVSTGSGGLFTKNAYVTYKLTVNGDMGTVRNLSVTIKVDANGNGNV